MKRVEHNQLTIKTEVKVGSLKLQYDVPKKWSINKFKCLLTSEIPSLNFDQFQICFKGKLQRGNYKMGEIEEKKINQKIELEIIKTKSQIKLADYYKASMQNFMSLAQYEKQPVLCTDYQNYRNMTKEKKNENNNNQNHVNDFNINQINDDFDQIQGNNPNNPAHPLLRLLRVLGTYFILVLIYDHGKAYQIAIILTIILAWFGIDIFIRYKQKKMKKEQNRQTIRNRNIEGQNQPNPNQILDQNIQNNARKGFLKLYFYKIVEVLYCFFFTFFPNLTIDVHLEINQLRIQEARKEINLILPNTYPPENPRANMNN